MDLIRLLDNLGILEAKLITTQDWYDCESMYGTQDSWTIAARALEDVKQQIAKAKNENV